MSLKLPEEFKAPNTYTDFALMVPSHNIGIYSGQDLANLRYRETCPAVSEVPQAVNTPIGSYSLPMRKSRAQPRDTSQLRGEDPEFLLNPDILDY